MQVDGGNAEYVPIAALHAMLRGALHSTVNLKLVRTNTGEEYTVVTLRHGFKTFVDPKHSSGRISSGTKPLSPSELSPGSRRMLGSPILGSSVFPNPVLILGSPPSDSVTNPVTPTEGVYSDFLSLIKQNS